MWKRVGVCGFFVVALVLSLVIVRCSGDVEETEEKPKESTEKIYTIGYSSSNYKELIDDFYSNNPDVRDMVSSVDVSKLDEIRACFNKPTDVFNCRVGDTFSIEDIPNHEYINIVEVVFVELVDNNTAIFWEDGYCFVVRYDNLKQNIMLNPETCYTLGFFSGSCFVDGNIIYIRSEVLE